MFLMKQIFLMILLCSSDRTFSSINGHPSGANDSSAKTADTKSSGVFGWIPQWCKSGYDNLFGNDGLITSAVSGLFGRKKEEPVEYRCCLVSDVDQSVAGNQVRDVSNDDGKCNKKESNGCIKGAGNAVVGAGSCVLGVTCMCGHFCITNIVKEVGGLLATIFIYLPVRGCEKLASCIPRRKSKTKPPEKTDSQKEAGVCVK